MDGGRPKRYRPESPAALIARISNDHGQALERLSRELDAVAVPETETLVELISSRALLQLMTHDVARASKSVGLLAPADAYPLLAPALRRPYAAGVALQLSPPPVRWSSASRRWTSLARRPIPGRGCPSSSWWTIEARSWRSRNGSEVRGHWSTAPTFVAGARLALERFGAA